MNIYDARVEKLQAWMKANGIKSYVIPCTDPHMSEECCDHYLAERFYFCPFHGAGSLLVTLDHYYIYTDGRFWTEAEEVLKGTSCILVYAGKTGVPSMQQFIKENDLYPLGLDSSLFSLGELRSFYLDEEKKIYHLSYRNHIENLPSMPKGKIFRLDDSLLTLSLRERVHNAFMEAKKVSAKALVVTMLDDVAYLLGYRGSDIECTPVFYSYGYIDESENFHLFIDLEKLPEDFQEDGVIVHPYDEFIPFLQERKDIPTSIDPVLTNSFICSKLTRPIYQASPVYNQKAIKGKVEIENTKRIQAIDGIAVLKLMKYVDDHLEDGDLNEYSLACYLDEERKKHPLCFDLSFPTIAAVDSNAAMMHYAPSQTVHSPLTKDNQLLLVDSGGQYYGGTTDTTRTFLTSENVSDEVKTAYTLTLKSQIALSTVIFEKGCSGVSLDILARQVMWKEGLDYKCGTGHGVGYISCVHEGPVSFRYHNRPGTSDGQILTPGNIITIEPGVYKAHKFGIRLENDALVVPAFETEDGIFYKLEMITYCPYDRRGIKLEMLTEEEIAWVDNYHQQVYTLLAPICDDDALLSYLKKQCAPLR